MEVEGYPEIVEEGDMWDYLTFQPRLRLNAWNTRNIRITGAETLGVLDYVRVLNRRPVLRINRVYPEDRTLELVRVTYDENNLHRMVTADPNYADTLFLFRENYVDFQTAVPGFSDQRLRMYNRYGDYKNRPRSVGIILSHDSMTQMETADFDLYKVEVLEQIAETVLMMKYKKIAVLVNETGSMLMLQDRPAAICMITLDFIDELLQYALI